MTTLKTFIRWPGNKSKHFGKFEKFLPDYDEYDRYVEPFLGSGAVFLKIQPENWIINDLNKDNINCWKTVRDHPEYLTREIEKFGKKFKKMKPKKKKVETCKNIIEKKLPNMKYDKKRAVNYMIMKDCSFCGVILIDNKFKFPSLCPSITSKNKYFFMSDTKLDNIENVSEFLNETKGKIYNTDYKDILCMTKKGDFVFLDPPYIEDHDYTFNYNENEELDNNFLEDLLEECNKLDDKGVMWMMTQAETKDVKKVFKGYNIKKFKVYRVSINDYVNELVIMNY